MAITYRFTCLECKLEDEIYLGITKMGIKLNHPPNQLGACSFCSRLFANTIRQCIYCFRQESPSINIFNWFKISLPNEEARKYPLKFYNEDELKKITCPKCNQKYLKSVPIVFSD